MLESLWKKIIMFKLIISAYFSVMYLLLEINATKTEKETFLCNKCSYTVHDQSNGFACVNETTAIPPNEAIKCGNYCITVEHWDINTKQVDSVFRSCSNNLGTFCRQDTKAITCTTSCKGHLCNNITLGGPHEINQRCNQFICPNDANVFQLLNVYKLLMVTVFIIICKH